MLTIRLQRTGKKNKPAFRIVLAEKTSAASKKVTEVLGHYNPANKQFGIKDQERLQYWIAQHVELSPTVHNLLVSNKMLDEKKTQAFTIPKKPVEPVAETPAAPASEAPAAEAPSEAPVEPATTEEGEKEKEAKKEKERHTL
jgi:small subunit ribosomal protein S16